VKRDWQKDWELCQKATKGNWLLVQEIEKRELWEKGEREYAQSHN